MFSYFLDFVEIYFLQTRSALKRFFPYFFHAVGDCSVFATKNKRIARFIQQKSAVGCAFEMRIAFGYCYPFELAAQHENARIDFFCLCAKSNLFKLRATGKKSVRQLGHAVGDCYFAKRGAPGKSVVSYACETLRQSYFLQTVVVVKSKVSYRSHALGQSYAFQRGALKRGATYVLGVRRDFAFFAACDKRVVLPAHDAVAVAFVSLVALGNVNFFKIFAKSKRIGIRFFVCSRHFGDSGRETYRFQFCMTERVSSQKGHALGQNKRLQSRTVKGS